MIYITCVLLYVDVFLNNYNNYVILIILVAPGEIAHSHWRFQRPEGTPPIPAK